MMTPANPRDPLTLRMARSGRETLRDPWDWWEGAREPEHCVIGFGGAMRPRPHPPRRSKHSSPLRRLLRRTTRTARALLRWLRAPSPWGQP